MSQFLAVAYAQENLADANEAIVVIECVFENSQKPKSCKVISEVPKDKGFGAYAVEVFMKDGSLSQMDSDYNIEDEFEEFRVTGQFTFKFELENSKDRQMPMNVK